MKRPYKIFPYNNEKWSCKLYKLINCPCDTNTPSRQKKLSYNYEKQ